MPMLTRLRGTVLTVAVAATVASLGAGPAFAATTWTVTPGGSVSGSAGTTTLKDTNTGTTLTCSSSKASGSLKSGSGLTNPIGSITTLTFSNCTGPLGITFTVTNSGPNPLNANSYSSGVTSGTITQIHATISGAGCSATVDGSSAGAHNGTVNATFTNSTSVLKVITTGSTLHIYNVSGCFGLLNNNDGATFSGSYTITPAQTVTSP